MESELREYAWSYFRLHADQRLRTFNFYLILVTLVCGGAVSILGKDHARVPLVLMALSLPFFSFVFWKLDVRNKQLIKIAEQAIKYMEERSGIEDEGEAPHPLKVFLYEDFTTHDKKRFPKTWPWRAHFSYSDSFNLVFSVFAGLGLLGAVVFLIC